MLNKLNLNPYNQQEALHVPKMRAIASEVFVQDLSLESDRDVEPSTDLSDLKWIHFPLHITEAGNSLNYCLNY